MTKSFFVGAILWFMTGMAPLLNAMAFYSTADTTFNTTTPNVGGTPSDGGWQWVGTWGSFQGAPISAHHFLTANHIGGTVSDQFTYQGTNYTTVRSFTDTASDLHIWEVRETFPSWAPLYRNATESGTMMVFGRGLTRGGEVRTVDPVTAPNGNVPANSLAGWYWGSYDGKLRWGQNTVAGVTDGGSFGQQLAATFNQGGGTNECHLATYDSSAPVFIKEGTTWKLAGIACTVDSGFRTTSTGASFNAFIFDKRGLQPMYGHGFGSFPSAPNHSISPTALVLTAACISPRYVNPPNPGHLQYDAFLADASTCTATSRPRHRELLPASRTHLRRHPLEFSLWAQRHYRPRRSRAPQAVSDS